MAEDIDARELQVPDYKAKLLADVYQHITENTFHPELLKSQESGLKPPLRESSNEMRELLREGQREVSANLFLHHCEGIRLDGIKYDGKVYGRPYHKKTDAGQKVVGKDWNELPRYLGFEKFLKK